MIRNIGRGTLIKEGAHLMEEMNKIYLAYGRKTYESFNWLDKFYSYIRWPNHSVLQGLSGPFLENVRRQLFSLEKNIDSKHVYTTFHQRKKRTPDQKKKVVLISMSKNNYTMSKIPGARCFISQEMYDNRNENFLKGLKILRSVNAEVITSYKLKQLYLYEVELKGMNVDVRQKDFILPEWRKAGWGGCFFNKEHYKLINSTFPSDVQKAILPETGGKVTNTFLLIKLVDNAFWSQGKKTLKKFTLKPKTC